MLSMMAGQQKLSDFFRESPLVGVELDLTRDKTPVRDNFILQKQNPVSGTAKDEEAGQTVFTAG